LGIIRNLITTPSLNKVLFQVELDSRKTFDSNLRSGILCGGTPDKAFLAKMGRKMLFSYFSNVSLMPFIKDSRRFNTSLSEKGSFRSSSMQIV